MTKTWVIVADGTKARLFTRERNRTLTECETIDAPSRGQRDREIDTDRPGRAFDSAGAGRHAMEPGVNATEQEQIKFSKQLTDRLEDLRNGGELEKLVLVAPPRFLGMLRGDLSRPLASLVVHSVDKELTAETPEGIAEKLPDFL